MKKVPDKTVVCCTGPCVLTVFLVFCSIIKMTEFRKWPGGVYPLSIYDSPQRQRHMHWAKLLTGLSHREGWTFAQNRKVEACAGPSRVFHRLGRAATTGISDSFPFACQLSRGMEAREYTKFTEMWQGACEIQENQRGTERENATSDAQWHFWECAQKTQTRGSISSVLYMSKSSIALQ